MRRVQTRAGHRQNFYHQTETNLNQYISNQIIRPPSSHPYSGYKSKKSQSQLRTKYSPNFFIEAKIQPQTQKKQMKNNFICSLTIEKLPQPFKLIVNQLKIAIKNNLNEKRLSQVSQPTNFTRQNVQPGIVAQFDELLQNLSRFIMELHQEKNTVDQLRQNLQKNLQEMSIRCTQFEKKLSKYEPNPYAISSNTQNRKTVRKIDPNYKKQQQVLLQNCRLGELNARYLARIAELQNRKVEKSVQNFEHKEDQSKTDTQLLRCHNRIKYLQMKLSTAEKMQANLNGDNQKLQEQIRQLGLKMAGQQKQLGECRQKMRQWRQRALMQKQDGQMHMVRQQFLLYSLKKLRENNKNLLNKFLSANKSDESIQKKDFIQNPNFEYQLDFFKSLPTAYQKGKGQRIYSHAQVHKNQLGLEIEEPPFQVQYQNHKKVDNFDISTLKYYRPSFFSFMQQSASPDIFKTRNKASTAVSRVFIQVLRSIMNSKLNQFMLLSDCPEKYTRFPEFVYGWFQKFYFNTEKSTVCALEPFMQKPITQQVFYKDLMNIRLDQTWQIITFRQFLLQQLSLQQLYFYLLCQSLLYSRAGISKQIQYYGDFSIMVEYSSAKSVLDITLNDFQSWNITFLTSKLREKIVVKKNREFIEAGFFLRCLLEYYKIERSNRLRYISKICNEFQDKKALRFSSFFSVINKFTEVPLQTKLKLYRDCYCLSKGAITAESIFTVCSEQLIFLKHLKMKSFYRLPKIIHKPSKTYTQTLHQPNPEPIPAKRSLLCITPPDPHLYDIIANFTHLLHNEQNILKLVQSLGVSDLNQQVQSIMKALDQRNSQIGTNVLKCRHFLHYFSGAVQVVRKASYSSLYELLEQQNKRKHSSFWIQLSDEDLGSIFAKEIKVTFQVFNEINKIKNWKDRVYEFRLNHAAKKIQRQVKKKFIEPYQEMYQYFNKDKVMSKESKN